MELSFETKDGDKALGWIIHNTAHGWRQAGFLSDEERAAGKATITALTRRNAKNGLVEVTIEAFNQKGELVLTDVTEAVVKCRAPLP